VETGSACCVLVLLPQEAMTTKTTSVKRSEINCFCMINLFRSDEIIFKIKVIL
jgi:hypothetical protein